jgi:hypothetical protein
MALALIVGDINTRVKIAMTVQIEFMFSKMFVYSKRALIQLKIQFKVSNTVHALN